MYEEQDDIFSVKAVERANGVLAKLFRTIVQERRINPGSWAKLMYDYLNNPSNGVQNNPKDRSSARGNLNKELHRTSMTWKVFRKAILFLAPVRATFVVRFEWRTDIPKHYEITEHSIVLLSSRTQEENPEPKEEPVSDPIIYNHKEVEVPSTNEKLSRFEIPPRVERPPNHAPH